MEQIEAKTLSKLSIEGFKSIRRLTDFELRKTNILIGANGAGKSNFIEIFRMLREMVDQNLQKYVIHNGGSSDLLFNGPKVTGSIKAHFVFEKDTHKNEYRFEFQPTKDERVLIASEEMKYRHYDWDTISKAEYESKLNLVKDYHGAVAPVGVGHYVFKAISSWVVYHFHDTSASAPMRRSEIAEDNKRLRPDASNIAPLLMRLKREENRAYSDIVNAVKLVTPFFADFILEPVQNGKKEKVKLMWQQKGSDYPMQAYHLSDGTLRFICLATALLQPNLPVTIIIDEPELGLHPLAISILAELIRTVPNDKQVIVSTQSPALVDCFAPEDIIVVHRKDGASTFERLHPDEFNVWLQDYSLGDLWRKDVVRGGPVNE